MASADRQTADRLMAELADQPYAFDFYAAVRLLQSNFGSHERIGYSSSPDKDPVRFAQSPALDFAASTLEALRRKVVFQCPECNKMVTIAPPDLGVKVGCPVCHKDVVIPESAVVLPPVFYSRHFGLFGPHGPLPLCLTEYARDRIFHHGDATFASFCNIFHHRMASFFFRAWADAHKTVDLDRIEDEHWSQFVGSLVGLGMASLHDCDSVPDHAKMNYAGRLVQQNRNAEGLAAILQDFFGIRTEVQTFVGRWLKLNARGSRNYSCRLGQSPETGSLGSNLIVGSQFWTCQLHFRLRLGPMKLADMERLLPTGNSFKRLRDWVRHYVGDELTWDAQLVLAKDEVPKTQLGKAGRLGWTTWLHSKPFVSDAEDLILNPN